MTFFIAISDRAADGQRLGLRPPQRLDLNQLSRVLCCYEAVLILLRQTAAVENRICPPPGT
ncbi:MAG: hypothetical protein WBA42_00455 [Mesorhizobium sp.]